jgi:glycosyltransferase involved in cell wall biosynthesis
LTKSGIAEYSRAVMRTFLELLPYRIEQALESKALRSARVRIMRWRNASNDLARPLPSDKRRLFVDMAVISNHDAGTGIQRVVRALAMALLAEAPGQWDIRFVAARRKRRYFEISWPIADPNLPVGPEMIARPGDVFIGLDYSLDAVRRHRRQLARFRRMGGKLWFLIHDLLPLNRPEWFSRNTVIRYRAWLSVMAGLADGFLCNSEQTETELRHALARVHGLRHGFHTQALPMGHSILEAPNDKIAVANLEPTPPRFDTALPFALMVGTLEPRKGHADILAAFDAMWQQGRTERLVLVGRLGWKVDTLREQIVAHPEFGTRLLWFDDVSDAELLAIYDSCIGVIIASLAEGFGLPLIEALGHGKPVLARNLAVFRVHDGRGVRFFSEQISAPELAEVAAEWLDDARQGKISVTLPTDDWRGSVNKMLEALEVN